MYSLNKKIKLQKFSKWNGQLLQATKFDIADIIFLSARNSYSLTTTLLVKYLITLTTIKNVRNQNYNVRTYMSK